MGQVKGDRCMILYTCVCLNHKHYSIIRALVFFLAFWGFEFVLLMTSMFSMAFGRFSRIPEAQKRSERLSQSITSRQTVPSVTVRIVNAFD
jgi:hypothetical protein